jgi:hypothetical protein
VLNPNTSMLLIQRNLNTEFILLLFSLIGTIFGVLGAIQTFMTFVEKRSVYFLEKRKRREEFQNMLKTVRHIRSNFEEVDQKLEDLGSTHIKNDTSLICEYGNNLEKGMKNKYNQSSFY